VVTAGTGPSGPAPIWIHVSTDDAWRLLGAPWTLTAMTPTAVEAVRRIGVLLVEDRRGVLGGMVRDVLENASGIDLVGDVTDIADASEAVARTGSDAVVWLVSEAAAAEAPAALLDRHPRLRIVAVEGRGTHGSLWRMRPHRTRLDSLWPERIVAELRGEP
jgi:hypothetical protein